MQEIYMLYPINMLHLHAKYATIKAKYKNISKKCYHKPKSKNKNIPKIWKSKKNLKKIKALKRFFGPPKI